MAMEGVDGNEEERRTRQRLAADPMAFIAEQLGLLAPMSGKLDNLVTTAHENKVSQCGA